tara:strand:- start:453 stop:665 length:213 start_codon:yes stop_codon:yes gene_type:complete
MYREYQIFTLQCSYVNHGDQVMEDRYVLTIQKKKYSFNYFYDNEKEARKAFHNSVSDYGLENVMVTKEVA